MVYKLIKVIIIIIIIIKITIKHNINMHFHIIFPGPFKNATLEGSDSNTISTLRLDVTATDKPNRSAPI